MLFKLMVIGYVSGNLQARTRDASLSFLFFDYSTMPKARRSKKKKHAEDTKPGKQGWIFGTKLVFFEARHDEWQIAVHNSKPGPFYTKITKLYKAKYGDLPEDEDLAEDVEDPDEDSLDDEEEFLGMSEAEKLEKQEAFKKLREVRTYCYSLLFHLLTHIHRKLPPGTDFIINP